MYDLLKHLEQELYLLRGIVEVWNTKVDERWPCQVAMRQESGKVGVSRNDDSILRGCSRQDRRITVALHSQFPDVKRVDSFVTEQLSYARRKSVVDQ